MQKFTQTMLISIFVITICGFVYAQDKGGGSIEHRVNTIQSVSADFIQEKHLKILAKPMISKGKLYYQAPRSLRWEYFTPVRSILLVHGGQTKRYVVKDQKIIEDSSAKMQSMQIVMDEMTMWISGRFTENPDFAVERKSKDTIVLTPVKEAFSKIISRIEIQLSNKPGIINSVMIRENEESYTKLDFKKVILNKKLSDSLFKEI